MLNNIDIDIIKDIAYEASDAIIKIYEKDFKVEYKDDKSPLTQADLEANNIICTRLKEYYSNIPILSEENIEIPYKERINWEYYWCIDPIDGTKEFIKRNGEFTINIALIKKGIPVLGVVLSPTTNDIYYAKKGFGAFKNDILLPIDQINKKEFLIVTSKSHLTEETLKYINTLQTKKKKKIISIGSSLKICLIAEGVADIYPRFAPTKEWDTAAAHAIVLESGKNIFHAQNNDQLQYNKRNLINPSFIVI
jgi:3'(2'), 5'-bisphosphate nucleotidase